MSEPNPGQGNTGAAGDDDNSFLDSLGDELKGNELFTGIEDAGQLAQKHSELYASHEELKSRVPEVPETADAYEFTAPEDITLELDKEGMKNFREQAYAEGYTQKQYNLAVTAALKRDQGLLDQYNQQRQETIDGLKTELGDKYDSSVELAKKVIRASGVEPPENGEDITSNPLFKTLLFLGGKISEDNLGGGAGTGQGGGSEDDAAKTMFGDMEGLPKK